MKETTEAVIRRYFSKVVSLRATLLKTDFNTGVFL